VLAIEVEYLLGRAVATNTTQRDRAEWPPHPTRLFSAFVDALSDVSEPDARARAEAALRWLEQQSAPDIQVSLDDEVSKRTIARHFVAINDDVAKPKDMRPTPLVELRTRQERFFPSVVPFDPCVVFAWPHSYPNAEQATALKDLASRIAYLGHSSSVVRVFCRDTASPATIAPSEDGKWGEWLLRVPGPGRFDRLNSVYTARTTNTFIQPPRGREVRYDRTITSLASGTHGSIRIFAFDENSERFGLTETAWLTSRFRAALFKKLPDGAMPEAISGHKTDGSPATIPHIAFVPLANISSKPDKYADGGVKGLGILIPRTFDIATNQLLDSGLSRLEKLVFGERGEIFLREVRPEASGQILYSLNASRYCRSSTTWTTVTPIALGWHPKPKKGLTVEGVVIRHLVELGLPSPTSVSVQRVSKLWGVPPARTFHRGDLKSLGSRILLHATIEFSECVKGPLAVGAARHMGFGLLHPCGERT